ncbi:heavy-metal-associated domain-containing protein [Flavobacterium sp.]|jgi:mercuric ion binding protein|uniref:heavy-metal-associated domain-containing protein n=1 Tax=Flavobacterium sp. TaxID=239 RepID=UPI0037BF411E
MKSKIHEYKINKYKIMSKNIIFGMMLLFVTLSTQAQEKKNKNANYDIEVNGNCEMCKKRIEKAAYLVKGVKSAEWHIDDHTLHLIINESKCSLIDVEKAVAKVGHDTYNVKATDEEYAKLHGCCQYERK